jgi:hypothetical protein
VKSNKYLFIIGFLSLSLIASLYLVARTTIFQKRASNTNTSYVLENSYIFASPLQAKADNKEQIRITVFLLDGRGLGVANQSVSLSLPQNISITNQQEVTDNTGKAVFDIISSSPQTFHITASVNDAKLPQKVRIIFY